MTSRWRVIKRVVTVAAVATVLSWLISAMQPSNGHSSQQSAHARLAAYAARDRAAPGQTCDPTASLRPSGPPVVTPGSFMAKIRDRGYLIVGVDQSTYHFGYLNPLDGQIEGFDIDMLHAISQAIFANPDKIRYVAMSDLQRSAAVESGEVDIVAHTMTITCKRLRLTDFSTVYFDAAQRVLVLRNSPAQSLIDVLERGGKVCATSGSTSLAFLMRFDPTYWEGTGFSSTVAVAHWTDCLVLLQQGEVAAISTDDTILVGLHAQDPFTKIIGPRLTNEPYGLAISQQHPDFVRFVNAVLAQMRVDGQWAAIYKRWIGTPVPAPPPAHYLG